MQGQIGVSQITFLIVDDVPTIRLILRRATALAVPHAVVYPAGSVADAHQILADYTVSMVITDYHLPDGNGFAVLNAARDIDQSIPVVLMSADSTIATAALAAGASAFLSKPFDMPKLLELLRQVGPVPG